MKKKSLHLASFFAIIFLAAAPFAPMALAASLPGYRTLLATQGRGPQVLGTQTGSQDSSSADVLDSFLETLSQSTDSVYHLRSEADVISVSTDKSSYPAGSTATVSVTGVTPGGQIAVSGMTSQDILAEKPSDNLFSSKMVSADSQGNVTLVTRSFTAADSGSWVVLAAEIPPGYKTSDISKIRYRMGLAKFSVGFGALASMQGPISDAQQGVSYSGGFKISVPTTTPLTFITMSLPKGIKASVSEASFASTTQTSLPLVGQTVVVDNTPPKNGAFTVNLNGVPQDSGVYFVITIIGTSSKPLDIDFLKFKVTASAAAPGSQPPPAQPSQGQQFLTMPLADFDSFVGLQMPGGGLSFPDEAGAYASQNVQVEGSEDIWWITDQGLKIKTPNRKIFLSYGNTDEDVVLISQEELNQYPDVQYIRLRGSGQVYKLSGNTKYLLSAKAKASLEVDDSEVAEVNKTEFNFYKTGKTIQK